MRDVPLLHLVEQAGTWAESVTARPMSRWIGGSPSSNGVQVKTAATTRDGPPRTGDERCRHDLVARAADRGDPRGEVQRQDLVARHVGEVEDMHEMDMGVDQAWDGKPPAPSINRRPRGISAVSLRVTATIRSPRMTIVRSSSIFASSGSKTEQPSTTTDLLTINRLAAVKVRHLHDHDDNVILYPVRFLEVTDSSLLFRDAQALTWPWCWAVRHKLPEDLVFNVLRRLFNNLANSCQLSRSPGNYITDRVRTGFYNLGLTGRCGSHAEPIPQYSPKTRLKGSAVTAQALAMPERFARPFPPDCQLR